MTDYAFPRDRNRQQRRPAYLLREIAAEIGVSVHALCSAMSRDPAHPQPVMFTRGARNHGSNRRYDKAEVVAWWKARSGT